MNKLNIQKYTPQVLGQYIEAFSVYRFDDDMDVQLFPKGVFEIVFQSHNAFQHNTAYSLGWKTRPRNFIGGLHNKSYQVKAGDRKNYCIVVEFKANTAKYFIPCKLHHFQNSLIDIFEVWGNYSIQLANKIHQENTDLGKIQQIENFLVNQFIGSKRSVIDDALYQILSSNGFAEVNQLAANAFLSLAQFRKRFKEEIGISPSQYSKVIRVNASFELVKKSAGRSLTDISYALGYFDQSHFIRDFKSVVGSSPKHHLSLKLSKVL